MRTRVREATRVRTYFGCMFATSLPNLRPESVRDAFLTGHVDELRVPEGWAFNSKLRFDPYAKETRDPYRFSSFQNVTAAQGRTAFACNVLRCEPRMRWARRGARIPPQMGGCGSRVRPSKLFAAGWALLRRGGWTSLRRTRESVSRG